MIDCQQAQQLAAQLLDPNFDSLERQVRDHVERCAECSAVVEESNEFDRQLAAVFSPARAQVKGLVRHVQLALTARAGHRCSILVVDDEPYLLPTLEALLRPEFEVYTAQSAAEAESLLASGPVDLLLSDQRMPGRSGVQLLEWARQHSPTTIRLLMTGYSELEDAVEAINRGHVYHYILKPWRGDDLLQTLRNAADKFRLERTQKHYVGELKAMNRELELRVEERTRELLEANQALHRRARELERLALTDPLTGLFNRRAVEELARFELKRHARYPSPLALGIIDVDRFKDINTRYLLTGGDEALRGLARVLSGSVREVDTVGRLGGEEFLLLARETGFEGAAALAERIRQRVQDTPIPHGQESIRLTVSVGVAVAEEGARPSYPALYEAASAALRQAKEAGRNCFVLQQIRQVNP